MLYNKFTVGFVVQSFNDAGEFVSQQFIAGDQVDYETEDGDAINVEDMPQGGNEYIPFDMTQPGLDGLNPVAEQLQENLMTYLDGMPQNVVDGVCQIVVDTLKNGKNTA